MKSFKIIGASWLLALLLGACLETPDEITDPTLEENLLEIEKADIPNNFDYSTQNGVTVKLMVPDFLKNAVVSLYTHNPGSDSLRFARVSFDENGYFESEYSIPTYIDSIMVISDYLGLTKQVTIPILGNKAEYDYRPLYDDSNEEISAFYHPNLLKSASADGFTYMGSYNYYGVPKYLEERDKIEQNLLDDINASLPEGKRLPQSHPEYLADGQRANLVLKEEADVWVTFVTEGAGWRNALGYYSYSNSNIPKTAEDIEELKIIFPNVSQRGSGGGLYPGDKVYLGQFPANTVISWFLVADGWSYPNVRTGNGTHFSQSDLNGEPEASLRQHLVMLYDKSREQFILGFEDVPRNWSWCDDDFNDAVFYATANPITAVKMDNVSEITAANDSDGDGINDELDDFPYDANKSFNNFSPSEESNGTLAFEDLWPSKGDYDFNDCVVNYGFNLIANSKNKISNIEATFTIKHIGAAYDNGFAFEMPIKWNKIKSIKGQVLNKGYMSLSNNGTEKDMDNAVIVVAENVSPLSGQTITLDIELTSALSKSDLGSVPFNPFLIVNGDREREVHLADMAPTSKGRKLLGQNDDYSSAETSRYFKTDRNLPWALNIYDNFEPSPEKVSINNSYPNFLPWANSGGTQNKDWYQKK